MWTLCPFGVAQLYTSIMELSINKKSTFALVQSRFIAIYMAATW
jgi:hypothetical protein